MVDFEQNFTLSYVQTRLEEKISEYSEPQWDNKLTDHAVRVDFEAMVRAILYKVKNLFC